MKKLVLMFVAIAAISFASCGNKTAEPVANADSDTAVVDSVVVHNPIRLLSYLPLLPVYQL